MIVRDGRNAVKRIGVDAFIVLVVALGCLIDVGSRAHAGLLDVVTSVVPDMQLKTPDLHIEVPILQVELTVPGAEVGLSSENSLVQAEVSLSQVLVETPLLESPLLESQVTLPQAAVTVPVPTEDTAAMLPPLQVQAEIQTQLQVQVKPLDLPAVPPLDKLLKPIGAAVSIGLDVSAFVSDGGAPPPPVTPPPATHAPPATSSPSTPPGKPVDDGEAGVAEVPSLTSSSPAPSPPRPTPSPAQKPPVQQDMGLEAYIGKGNETDVVAEADDEVLRAPRALAKPLVDLRARKFITYTVANDSHDKPARSPQTHGGIVVSVPSTGGTGGGGQGGASASGNGASSSSGISVLLQAAIDLQPPLVRSEPYLRKHLLGVNQWSNPPPGRPPRPLFSMWSHHIPEKREGYSQWGNNRVGTNPDSLVKRCANCYARSTWRFAKSVVS
ncbi:hypothetical protein [Paenibacillus koleovorans]|uniref:hypothetical protein n=1 Tax=Paenibacillus koleovorans TaxID=121608 RepID=UPI0013E330B6|nr:hypothetical protein [Paenibacillus koleovorans]